MHMSSMKNTGMLPVTFSILWQRITRLAVAGAHAGVVMIRTDVLIIMAQSTVFEFGVTILREVAG